MAHERIAAEPASAPEALRVTAARPGALSRLQSTLGNRGMGRLIARTEITPGNLEVPADIAQEYTVSPEMEQLMARLARGEVTLEQAEAEAAKLAARQASAAGGEATGTSLRQVVGEILTAEVAVGIIGAYITIKATLATLEEGAEERRVADAIVAGTDGYVAGFMSGLGFGGSGGSAAWFAQGKEDGARARGALVAKVRADPRLRAQDIGPDEVMLTIRDRRDRLHAALYAQAKRAIGAAYLRNWHAGLGWWERTFTTEETSGEQRIRTRAGLPPR